MKKITYKNIEKIKDWRSLKEFFPNFDWCIFENHVINLDNFIHPGGNYIIKQIIGYQKHYLIYYITLLYNKRKGNK